MTFLSAPSDAELRRRWHTFLSRHPRVPRYLYHGTSVASAERILKSGFRASSSRDLGRGVYFYDRFSEAAVWACERHTDPVVVVVVTPITALSAREIFRRGRVPWSGLALLDHVRSMWVVRRPSSIGPVVELRSVEC